METPSEQIKAEARACDLRKLEQAKRMTPTERFLAGTELFEEACQITLAGIRADFPDRDSEFHLEELRRLLTLRR